jgi:hypothetical protein
MPLGPFLDRRRINGDRHDYCECVAFARISSGPFKRPTYARNANAALARDLDDHLQASGQPRPKSQKFYREAGRWRVKVEVRPVGS